MKDFSLVGICFISHIYQFLLQNALQLYEQLAYVD